MENLVRECVEQVNGAPVVVIDSLGQVTEDDQGAIIVCASHGGAGGALGKRLGLRAMFFNDAGVGKENAGVRTLEELERDGIPGGTVSNQSARIGVGMDSWNDGILSHVNTPARERGMSVGDKLAPAIRRAFGEGSTGQSDGSLTMSQLLRDSPKNWGRWGETDEIGALNFLGKPEALRGVAAVKQGNVFTLQLPMMRRDGGDPVLPGRLPAQHYMTIDKGKFLSGKAEADKKRFLESQATTGSSAGQGAAPAPLSPIVDQEFADDVMFTALQGTTHYDALGHAWIGDSLYNGFDSRSTIGGLERASVLPIAEHGVVGSGVLLDVARWLGKESLDPSETFDHDDLIACAKSQGVELQSRDVLIIRTGWIARFYRDGKDAFPNHMLEPGLTYSPELVEWFRAMEIPNLVTDTFGNEVMLDPKTGLFQPLHFALMSYLGVLFTELAWLEDLAKSCAEDGQYSFLYAAAPLKVDHGTGGPVNPIVIK